MTEDTRDAPETDAAVEPTIDDAIHQASVAQRGDRDRASPTTDNGQLTTDK